MYRVVSSLLGVMISFHAIAASCQSTAGGQTVPPANSESPKTSLPAAGDSPRSTTPSDASQPVLLTRAKPEEGLRIGGGDLLQVASSNPESFFGFGPG